MAKAAKTAPFGEQIATAYATKGDALRLGTGVHEDELEADAVVQVPLRMLNRHGLIAGATGTGKTRTLQLIAEQLSAAGVPTFLADVKSDVSGMAEPGGAEGAAATRMKELGLPYEPTSFPVELYSLGGIGPGIPIRAAVSDFGPQLLAKILGANETQEQSLSLVFRYADEQGLGLVDLSDLRALLAYLDSDEGKGTLEGLGGVSSATIGVLLRSLVALEDGGGTEFFGEPQLVVDDLLRTAPDGRGIVSCLELSAVQGMPTLWSTALMWLVAELFEELPEVGDRDEPKLVFFFDEAHLLFKDATPAFLDSVVRTVRLIRSKGVGVFFVTQSPTDLPRDVLGQLGNRVQHALRAFTPEDADALRQTVRTFPESDLYDLEELLTQLGIGEAAVTILNEKGVPTPVVHTRLVAPRSNMSPAADLEARAKSSPLFAKYGTRADPESAREKLAARMEASAKVREAEAAQAEAEKVAKEAAKETAKAPRPSSSRGKASTGNPVLDFLGSRQGQAIGKEIVRGVFGMLKKRR
jgi:DNA double-strand break repair helicase HerA and related ATPase